MIPKRLKKDEMTIGGWVAPYFAREGEKNFLTDETFKTVKESGLNTLYTNGWPVDDTEIIAKGAATAERNGVFLNVGAECLRSGEMSEEECRKFIAFCKGSAGIVGLNVFDEPQEKDFETIARIKEKYGKEMEDLLFYANMLPIYAESSMFGGCAEKYSAKREQYAAFVEKYLQTVKPEFLSYDFYPFRHEKGVCDSDYFVQLSDCIKAAKRHKIPLWNFVQVTSWYRDYIRTMTYSEISWQVATALAYGVTGIQYFCYWTPCDNGGETFGLGMIDKEGKRTRSWYFVKEINKHLKAVQKYILAAKHIGVIAVGDTLAPVPEEDRMQTFGNISKIKADGILIGCFELHGKNMYYIVNTSVLEERIAQLEFSSLIRFKQIRGENVQEFSARECAQVLHGGEGILLIED